MIKNHLQFDVRFFSIIFLIIFFLPILESCSTSNNVASNKLFQKRKYRKGWNINAPSSFNTKKNKENTTALSSKNELDKNFITGSTKTNNSVLTKKNKNNSEENRVIKIKKRATNKSFTFAENSILKNSLIEKYYPKLTNKQAINNNVVENVISSPPMKEETKRVLLAILGILILIFTGIAPLAVWISIGRGGALTISLKLYLLTIILAILFIVCFTFILFSTAAATPASLVTITIILAIATFVSSIATFVHALISIIRGF